MERWDHDVHRRLVRGDDGALAEVYDRLADIVFGLAIRVTRDKSVAEDLTQEVFLYLWERPEMYDPSRGPLRPWLCAIIHRRSIDWLRRAQVRQRSAGELAMERSIVSNPDNVEEQVVADSVARAVRGAVDRLPTEQRDVLVLAYFTGLTHAEIARKLGIPEGTAKSRIRLGLRRLAGHLGELGIA